MHVRSAKGTEIVMSCAYPKKTIMQTTAVILFLLVQRASSFLSPNPLDRRLGCAITQVNKLSRGRRAIHALSVDDQNEEFVDMLFLERFRRRKLELEQRVAEEQLRRPPNLDLSAQETVREILLGLRQPHDPQRYFGLEILLGACTAEWRAFLCQSVAASRTQDNTAVAAALEAAMSRPHNQFRILLGLENDGYKIDFPTETLDYGDGTCWLECRLRSNDDNDKDELLVALGWSLVKEPKTNAWVVDGLDWQDFRDAYRPGIGREEWERICG